MISPDLKTFLEQRLSQILSQTIQISGIESVTGGSINHTFRLNTSAGFYFLKVNDADIYPGLFNKERQGLQLLQQFIRTPAVLLDDLFCNKQLLVMEWIGSGSRTDKFWENFGTGLAMLHQQTSNAFGLNHDNYMGSLPQLNSWQKTWPEFFMENRLKPQIRMAIDNGLLPADRTNKQLEKLGSMLPEIFAEEKPGLLHGDLWSGNFICSAKQEPVLVDPAVYYGHRSVDLGMTTLFGRFGQRFYDAYHYQFPFPGNYEEQWEIANLYPLLIHLNLFGRSYLESVKEVLEGI